MTLVEFPITPEGLKKLKEEVDHLKKVERPRISEEIGAAIELGDLKENFEKENYSNAIRIAIIGRPNVGKSSLVNALLNCSRCIVSDIPGTTRDAIDSVLQWEGTSYTLIDTAGVYKRKDFNFYN